MEDIQTGFSKVDDIRDELVKEVDENGDGKVDYIMDKKEINDNTQLQSEADDIIDFTEKDPFSEGKY
jgi:hypothetical protein